MQTMACNITTMCNLALLLTYSIIPSIFTTQSKAKVAGNETACATIKCSGYQTAFCITELS